MTSVAVTAAEMFRVSVPTVATELIGEQRRVLIPAGITDLAAFRAWACSDQLPEGVRVDYLGGVLWVDLSMEELYWHNQVKAAVYAVLLTLVRSSGSGRFIPDRMRLSYPGADASVEPDGVYVSYDALTAGRVRETSGRGGGVIELEGAVDMVLEVVSPSSQEKDHERLPEYYAEAGVPEFWRADVRGELRFEILRLTQAGYVAADESGGWWRSEVFGRWFRLAAGTDPRGKPEYTLEVRP